MLFYGERPPATFPLSCTGSVHEEVLFMPLVQYFPLVETLYAYSCRFLDAASNKPSPI